MQRRLVLAAAACAALVSGCAHSLVAVAFFQPAQQIGPAALPPGTAEVRIPTGGAGETVQCFLAAHPGATRCVVFLHGTGGYAAQRLPFAVRLADAAACDVVVAEFRGYGDSPGEPSEASVYEDARAALRWARTTLGHPPERIVLMGRSLGTAIACEVLRDDDWAGAVLLTPFLSGKHMAGAFGFGALDWTLGEPFDSKSKIGAYHGPVLMIHGTDDRIVPFEQGEQLFELANDPKEFVAVEGAPHNRIFPDEAAGYARLGAFVVRCTPAGARTR